MSRAGRWAYAALLRTLPRGFREAHGTNMRDLFAEALEAAARRGRLAWIGAWVRGAADVLEFAVKLRSAGRGRSAPARNPMESARLDLAFALRSLLRAPGFAALAVVTLAVGIGANTAIFSLVNAVLLRPPTHVRAPDEIVSVFTSDYSGPRYGTSSYMDYEGFRTRTPALADAVLASPGAVSLAGDDGLSRTFITEFVSGNYFRVLGVPLARGRGFTAEEGDWSSGEAVAVVSHALWTREFGGDPGIVGRTLRLSGQSVTVVGVAPEDFGGSLPVVTPDFWLPLSTQALIQGDQQFRRRGSRGSLVRARLAPGASLETAQARLDALATRIHADDPTSWTDVNGDVRKITVVRDARLPPQLAGAVTGFALLLVAAVGTILLIACANVANLTLARTARRRRELAVRLSLGAGRGRIVRQLLAESVLLGSAGGVGGMALAWLTLRFAETVRPVGGVAVAVDLGMDGRVFLFSFAATFVTVAAVGLLPALRASRPDLVASLKEGTESGAGRFRWFHLRNLLVVGQVSASLVLLVGAGLFVKSLGAALSVDPGFDTEGLATVTLNLGPEGYSPEEAATFFGGLADRVSGFPAVTSVTVMDVLPMTLLAGRRAGVQVPGYTPAEGEDLEFQFFSVGPGFVETVGMELRAGREFTAADAADAEPTVIVNESFAAYFWPGEPALGQLVTIGSGDARVVGLLADAMYRDLRDTGRPAFFVPTAQNPSTRLTLVARTAEGAVPGVLAAMRDEIRATDRRLTGISALQSMDEAIAFTLLPQRIASWLLSLAGGLGMLLATVGLYGVMSYVVSQRTREVGVRMALGARAGDVVGMIVRRGLVLAVLGSAAGLALAAGLTRFLQALLYGVSPLDATVFGLMGLTALAVAALASWVPARRAAALDPATTLREE